MTSLEGHRGTREMITKVIVEKNDGKWFNSRDASNWFQDKYGFKRLPTTTCISLALLRNPRLEVKKEIVPGLGSRLWFKLKGKGTKK